MSFWYWILYEYCTFFAFVWFVCLFGEARQARKSRISLTALSRFDYLPSQTIMEQPQSMLKLSFLMMIHDEHPPRGWEPAFFFSARPSRYLTDTIKATHLVNIFLAILYCSYLLSNGSSSVSYILCRIRRKESTQHWRTWKKVMRLCMSQMVRTSIVPCVFHTKLINCVFDVSNW